MRRTVQVARHYWQTSPENAHKNKGHLQQEMALLGYDRAKNGTRHSW